MYSLSRSLTRGLDAARKTVWRKCGARSFTATSVPGEADEEVKALSQISTQSIVDALWLNDYPQPYIHGARPMRENMKCAGRAVTLRFVPHRPDVAADKPQGENSPEYTAFELCGPGQVLVTNSCGPYESVGGDIKFLRLAQRKVGGIVTEGSVRDSETLEEYGLPIFSFSTSAKQGPAVMQPWGVNDVISCGGVTVRPDDIVVGDRDGVVVVPKCMAQTVIETAIEREEIENILKSDLEANPASPGKYYPFRQPLQEGTALYDLVARVRSEAK